jgi:D-lactate dehydrogenase (cytochrome)
VYVFPYSFIMFPWCARLVRGRGKVRQTWAVRFQSTSRASKPSPVSYLFTAGVFTGIGFFSCQHFTKQWSTSSSNSSSTQSLASTSKPVHDTSDSNIRAAREEFTKIVGAKNIDDQSGNLKARSSTEWSQAPNDRIASLIVFPNSTEEVSEVMKVCHRRRIPVTGYSGGTSLDGALAATRGGICLDFSNMNKILALHKGDMDVVVQPAVGWEDLNRVLANDKLFFGPDGGPGSQIGGMIGTNCSGPNAYRYGPMKDWVISTTIVLADGTIVKTRNRPRKSSAGYDLTRLIVGSSGTLGLVTEAVLKVTAAPENEQVAAIAFPSTQKAVDTVIELVQKAIPVSALELLDAFTMKAVNQSGYTDKQWKETPTLFLKFSGTKAAVQEQLRVVKDAAKKNNSQSWESSADPAQISAIWSARKTALWSLIAMKKHPDDEFGSADIAVPISRLAQILEETNAEIEKRQLLGSTLGHVGDGNFHISVLFSKHEKEAAEQLMEDMRRRGIEMEGTITGEHGIGLLLRDMLEVELGINAVDMMRKVSAFLRLLVPINS